MHSILATHFHGIDSYPLEMLHAYMHDAPVCLQFCIAIWWSDLLNKGTCVMLLFAYSFALQFGVRFTEQGYMRDAPVCL